MRVFLSREHKLTRLDRNNRMNKMIYPIDICETCINELDELITSGEITEARERIEELEFNGSECPTCIRLQCGMEVA